MTRFQSAFLFASCIILTNLVLWNVGWITITVVDGCMVIAALSSFAEGMEAGQEIMRKVWDLPDVKRSKR